MHFFHGGKLPFYCHLSVTSGTAVFILHNKAEITLRFRKICFVFDLIKCKYRDIYTKWNI